MPGIKLRRLPVGSQRGRLPSLGIEGQAKSVVGFGQSRIERYGLPASPSASRAQLIG